jgi:ribonuclease HI
MSKLISVYTDGSCSPNPGKGGWAWAVGLDGLTGSGYEAVSTNQRMELLAAFDAMRTLLPLSTDSFEIVSDSSYLINAFHKNWIGGWLKRGWKNSQGDPVANQDIWRPLIALYDAEGHGRVTFRWVKGHAGDPGNELVDKMAVAARKAGAK